MDAGIFARTLVVIIVVIGLAAAIMVAQKDRPDSETGSPRPAAKQEGGRLRSELRRCRDLGPEAADDAACIAAWAESRDHFLMRDTDTPEAR
ncbi:putative entry exclusion protein TrbK-alt [Nitratireductor rhodophyticola]|uniref:putative entry exclusion protein TrbK-alt n=1 Tax=Nitratireductor rhodophyticola TaxID=2854036 RepID=UPI003BAAFB6F